MGQNVDGEIRPRIGQVYSFCSGLILKGVARSYQGVASTPPRHTLNEALLSSQVSDWHSAESCKNREAFLCRVIW